jgi:hypothetical protein
MVYLAKKGDAVVHHTDKKALKELDGIAKADMEVSDEEFEAAGGIVRVIDGEIVLGKTEAEKQAEANTQRVTVLKNYLAATDYIAVKIAEGSATKAQYADKIAQRTAWRQEIQELESA